MVKTITVVIISYYHVNSTTLILIEPLKVVHLSCSVTAHLYYLTHLFVG